MNRLSTTGPFALTFSPNITGSWPTHQKDLKHHTYKKHFLLKSTYQSLFFQRPCQTIQLLQLFLFLFFFFFFKSLMAVGKTAKKVHLPPPIGQECEARVKQLICIYIYFLNVFNYIL